MPATARQINVNEEQLAGATAAPNSESAAAYALIEVPGDYFAKLVDVQDYDFRAKGKTYGWLWIFEIEGCPFKEYTSYNEEARWKLIQTWEACGGDVSVGVNNMDPNTLIGNVAGAHVDWQKDPATLGANDKNYREIKYLFVPPADEAPFEAAVPEVL